MDPTVTLTSFSNLFANEDELKSLRRDFEAMRQHVAERDAEIKRLGEQLKSFQTNTLEDGGDDTPEESPKEEQIELVRSTTSTATYTDGTDSDSRKLLLPKEGGLSDDKLEEEIDDDEELEEHHLPSDIFSLMFYSEVGSSSFVFGCLVFCQQLLVLSLIIYDLLQDQLREDEDDGNRFNVPVEVEVQVRISQVAALLIAVVSRDDVTDTFRIVSVGYKQKWRLEFPGATFAQFIMMNVFRFTEGCLVIFVSFIFIVQSDNVLDLFLNFAAIEFVSNLDNLAYNLAQAGWTTRSMQDLIERIENTHIYLTEEDKAHLKKCPWAKHLLVFSLFAALFGGWGKIYRIQASGELLESTSCGVVRVEFGDEMFTFASSDKDKFFGFDVVSRESEISEHPIRNLVGSSRILGVTFNETSPPDLVFSFFSGNYEATFNPEDIQKNRPVYYERGFKDITSGKFYYCEKEMAWVFTIPALGRAKALPESTLDRCGQDGWLLRSPVTEAFSLDEVPLLGWKIWTGSLVDTFDFRLECGECESDIDCGVTRGQCVDGSCECDPQFEGNFCNDRLPCTELVNYYRGGHVLFSNASGFEVYDRPLYERPTSASQFELLMYTGRRWYDVYFQISELQVYLELFNKVSLEEFSSNFTTNFHAFWGNVLRDNLEYFSEPTSQRSPTGNLEWQAVKDSRSVGFYGFFGATKDFDQKFACASVDCNVERICGDFGTCTKVKNITIQGGSKKLEWPGGQCVCNGNITGHFCEYENKVVFDKNGTLMDRVDDVDPYLAACLGPFSNWSTCWSQLYGLDDENLDLSAIGGKEGSDFNETIELVEVFVNTTDGSDGNETDLNISVAELDIEA